MSKGTYQYIPLRKRLLAFTIDSVLLLGLRILVASLGAVLLQPYRTQFVADFKTKFNLEKPDFSNMEQAYFLLQSTLGYGIIAILIVLLLLGFAYYGITSSKWHASFGQRAAGFYLVHSKGHELKPTRLWIRTIISYVPWALLPLLFYLWYMHYRGWAICIAALLCCWHDLRVFCGKQIALHDVLTNTWFVLGRKKDS
jgi:uncharacterized RDD family membrane protein YckC